MSLGQAIKAIEHWNKVHGAKEGIEPPSDEEINAMLVQHGFEPEDG